jgi:hypothetical protein
MVTRVGIIRRFYRDWNFRSDVETDAMGEIGVVEF